MKAIELLRQMDYDSALAEYGMIIDLSADSGIQHWFGESARLASGKLSIDNFSTPYYALWESNMDNVYWFLQKFGYDAKIVTDEDTIYLQRIEQC